MGVACHRLDYQAGGTMEQLPCLYNTTVNTGEVSTVAANNMTKSPLLSFWPLLSTTPSSFHSLYPHDLTLSYDLLSPHPPQTFPLAQVSSLFGSLIPCSSYSIPSFLFSSTSSQVFLASLRFLLTSSCPPPLFQCLTHFPGSLTSFPQSVFSISSLLPVTPPSP